MVVVVIAQHGEHAERRGDPLERFGRRADVLPVSPGDVIAAKHHEIGPFVHQHRDRANDVVVRHPAAAVHVGQKTDAQSAERWRQARHRNGGGGELELVASVQKSVRAGSCNRADARRGERAKDRPASHRHTLLY